jgi:hypothetical protein
LILVVERVDTREGWIMKDCDSRRSWIGGEGLPSRDQVKEKREQRQPQVGFSQVKPQERVVSYGFFRTVFLYMYGSSVETGVYMWVCLRKSHVHLEKHADLGCTTDQTFPGLSAVVFLLVGHYPYYGSPDFSIIKSFSTLVFPPGFFQGYLPKNIGVYVCMIWFPFLLPLDLFELNIPTVYFCFVSC